MSNKRFPKDCTADCITVDQLIADLCTARGMNPEIGTWKLVEAEVVNDNFYLEITNGNETRILAIEMPEIDRAIELLKGKDNLIHEMEIKLNTAYEANKVATEQIKKHEKTLRMLRETMEDMERGNASEDVSYLLRLMDKWE